jgi:hypothetical protein
MLFFTMLAGDNMIVIASRSDVSADSLKLLSFPEIKRKGKFISSSYHGTATTAVIPWQETLRQSTLHFQFSQFFFAKGVVQ